MILAVLNAPWQQGSDIQSLLWGPLGETLLDTRSVHRPKVSKIGDLTTC